MIKRFLPIISCVCLLLGSCQDDEEDLPSFDDRVSTAIAELTDELTDPANGWRLDYQPTPDAGLFFVLLDFDEDGQVVIQSDLAVNDGEFFEQTIPYRIDNALGLELILETYGVFHYLFEQDQSRFGAEFEFIFNGKEGDNLVFQSKSDISTATRLDFTPADPGAASAFSREEAENLDAFDGLTTQVFGGDPPVQHLVLNDRNLSLFWSIDISRRVIDVDIAGVGTTIEEIAANGDNVTINHVTGYTLLNGRLVLMDPFTFSAGGEQVTVSEITLSDFSMTGPPLCELNMENTPVYTGQGPSIGSVTLYKSLFDSDGLDFVPMAGDRYGVNVVFVFNEQARSLAEEGSISERFPEAVEFVFHYGLDSTGLPANAVGFRLEDEQDSSRTYLREFEPITTTGNKLQVTLTNDFYYSKTPEAGEEQSLIEITDEIFESGEIYVSDLPTDGLTVFRLFNPCNRYEIFLVQ